MTLALCAGVARAQNLPSERAVRPGEASSLGPAIGSAGMSEGAPGSSGSILGTRPGAGSPRVPAGITEPGGGRVRPLPEIGPLAPLEPTALPAFGPLSLPTTEDEGPPGGLTLDEAIGRVVAANIELRAKALEIPQARADVLTAGLRGNPLIYADSQLIPYGGYSDKRPGGPTQYDINITQPFDISGKRKARTEVACQALKVLEAQFQDAVRQQVGLLNNAFVDALAARETVRFARASVEGFEQVVEVVRSRRLAKDVTLAELNRVEIQRESASIALRARPASFWAARFGTIAFYGQSSGVYDHYFNTFLNTTDIIWSFLQAVVMAVVIMLVHTYYGFTARGGPAGVGEAVGRAVRTSLILSAFVLVMISLAVYGQSGNFNLAG